MKKRDGGCTMFACLDTEAKRDDEIPPMETTRRSDMPRVATRLVFVALY